MVEYRGIYLLLDLTSCFNCDGISSDTDRSDGDFNGSGATYPAEDLPESNALLQCRGVPFRFPDKGDARDNNMALEGQRVPVPRRRYETLYLLGAAEEDFEDTVRWIGTDGMERTARLGLSGWGKGHDLRYGECVAVRCSGYHFPSRHVYTGRVGVDYGLWMQKLPIPAPGRLAAIQFPDNPGMHIFATTLRRACAETSRGKL